MTTTTPTSDRSWPHYTEPAFVDVQGLRSAYRRAGQGERVLFLHGAGPTRVWLPFYELLAGSVELVVPEHPGSGDSAVSDEIQSFEDLVLHYDALLDMLELDPAHVVAQGIGGWLAAYLAVVYPRRFKSLTLITPAGLRLPDAPFIDPFRMTPEERLEALFNGRAAAHAELLTQEGELEDMIRGLMESTVAARLMWNPRYDHRLDHRLRRVRAPTLVIGVEDDRMIPEAMSARYAELITDARLEIVRGPEGQPSGHLPTIEHPGETARLVAGHVTACAGGPR